MNFEFGAIEIFAIIVIAIAVIKIIIILVNPTLWLDIVEKIYIKPEFVSIFSLILAALVLYFIINAGISIVEILAVCLFIALLMLTGTANYADEIMGWAREQNIIFMVKRLWLYTLVWVILLAWGIKELFLNK